MQHRPSRSLTAAIILATITALLVATPASAAVSYALSFNGTSQYVTFGAAPSLGATNLTLEAWFKWTGGGVATSTGTGGITSIIPLLTKGRGEADGDNRDMNWFLGISGGKLAADFEENPGGGNNPATGATTITTNVWHHAAATYDGGAWKLYLDGNLDATVAQTGTPRSDSIQHAAIGSALTSTGAAGGYFAGAIDEARVWNVVRTQAEIRSTIDQQLTSGSGLIGRWGLNEGSGTIAANSVGGAPDGTLTNGPTWTTGPVPIYGAPSAPTSLIASGGVGAVDLDWADNAEADLAGYNVYRGGVAGFTPSTPLNAQPIVGSAWSDASGTPGTTYYYLVQAVDFGGNLSTYSNEASASALPIGGNLGLGFNGSTQHVTFGAAPALGVSTFTVETWFRRTGAGTGTTTGTGGIASAIPLVTKGRGEAEGSNVDMNYFLGIDASSGVLVADFEEGAGQPNPGLNHPVSGATVVTSDEWHHAAATYDGTTWRLYLDGRLDARSIVGAILPRSDSIQHAAIATAMTSTGVPAGYFQGRMDEVRVWNIARSGSQIRAARTSAIPTATGLVGRWSLDEGTGAAVADSSGGGPTGTLVNGPTWVAGAPLDPDTVAPAAPTGLTAEPNGSTVTLSWTPPADADVAGYDLYRDTSPGVMPGGTPVNGQDLVAGTTFQDTGLTTGTTYHYVAVAVDTSDNRSDASGEASATPVLPGALGFDGANDHVALGVASPLGQDAFTIETWFRWTGGGTTANTGSGGVNAIPLVTKGRGEADGSNVDMNWFLGIAGGKLAADFEDTATGLNHPVTGASTISTGVWHHAAATYDGTTWRLYLDGVLDATSVASATPRFDSIQHAAMATAMNSSGVAEGYFAGRLDEVRVWDHARSEAEIVAGAATEITSASGLVGRWGFAEGTGTTASDSSGSGVHATLVNGPTWVSGAPFTPFPAPPDAPTLVAPADGSEVVGTTAGLQVVADDPDGGDLTVEFYGRQPGTSAAPNVTLVAIPDTQNYSLDDTAKARFIAQTQWAVDQRDTMNIGFVTHLGDITENGDSQPTQWVRADEAWDILDADGLPSGLTMGNHDMPSPPTAAQFDATFGPSRHNSNAWYGGNYGQHNSWQTFSSGDLQFLIMHLEFDVPDDVVTWANGVIDAHPNHRVIITTHRWLKVSDGTRATSPLVAGTGRNTAQDVWTDLVQPNCNVFMVLSGHDPGENYRSDPNACGNPVHQFVVDYQSRTNGGDGWLRYFTFEPSVNQIEVHSYSPTLGTSETDANSRMTLDYEMSTPFALLDTVTVPAGSTASTTWNGLARNTNHEWFAVVSDGTRTTSGPAWSFTTGMDDVAWDVPAGQRPANRPRTCDSPSGICTDSGRAWMSGRASLAQTAEGPASYLHATWTSDAPSGDESDTPAAHGDDCAPNCSGVFYGRSSDGGDTWDGGGATAPDAVRVSPADVHADRAAITASGSRVYVTYVTTVGMGDGMCVDNARVLWLRVNTDHGAPGAWLEPIRLSSVTRNVDAGSVWASGSDVYVIWTASGSGDIKVALSEDGGINWSKDVIGHSTATYDNGVSPGSPTCPGAPTPPSMEGYSGRPVIAGDGTTVGAAWLRTESGKTVAKVSIDGGHTFVGGPCSVSTPLCTMHLAPAGAHGPGEQPTLSAAAAAGRVAFAFVDDSGTVSPRGLYVRLYSASTGWQPKRLVSCIEDAGSCSGAPAAASYDEAYAPSVALYGSAGIGLAWSACPYGPGGPAAPCDGTPQDDGAELLWKESWNDGATWSSGPGAGGSYRLLAGHTAADSVVNEFATVVFDDPASPGIGCSVTDGRPDSGCTRQVLFGGRDHGSVTQRLYLIRGEN